MTLLQHDWRGAIGERCEASRSSNGFVPCFCRVALSSKAIDPRSHQVACRVVCREAAVGALCGAALGMGVLAFGWVTKIVSFHVAIIVAISLPLVSVWANLIGAVLPLVAARLRYNPALTSAPLMTTIIDSSGLLLYFAVAQAYYGIRFRDARYSDMVDRHHALPSVPSPAALLMGAASHGSHHRVGG